jgi:hypothetical protein
MTNTSNTAGTKYNRNLDITEIAKMVRKELKDPIFSGLKFSVRIDRFSMGQSLDVTITDAPEDFTIKNPEFYAAKEAGQDTYNISRYNDNAIGLLRTVENIVSQYNYDNSDTQTDYFDVNFYSNVSFCYKRFDD